MRRMFAAAVAMFVLMSQAGVVAAYGVISASGTYGSYDLTDSTDQPAATCSYGPEFYPDNADLRWVKVRAPQVFATDSHPSQRDSQKVTWQFKLRVRALSSSTWHFVASSNVQHGTAYDDQPAPFTAMKVYWKGESVSDPVNHLVQALVILKWYTSGGAVAGTVKFIPTYYRIKAFGYSATGGQPYCQAETTAG